MEPLPFVPAEVVDLILRKIKDEKDIKKLFLSGLSADPKSPFSRYINTYGPELWRELFTREIISIEGIVKNDLYEILSIIWTLLNKKDGEKLWFGGAENGKMAKWEL